MTTCVDMLPPDDRLLCEETHCSDFANRPSFHAICHCLDWQGNPIPDCAPKDIRYPVQTGQCAGPEGQILQVSPDDCYARGAGWRWQMCFCCCACFASATPIGVPEGFREIGELAVGDQVLTAAWSEGVWKWQPRTVQFSSGSPANVEAGGNLMIHIQYGADATLLAAPNQLFMVASGKLKRADQLVPGSDRLLSPEGAQVEISRIQSGMYYRAIHHLATEVTGYEDFTGAINHHLINLNGVICGDYLLQLYQGTAKMAAHLADASAPAFGSEAYEAQNSDLHVRPHMAAVSSTAAFAPVDSKGFRPHGPSTLVMPDNAAQLFSAAQERMLLGPAVPKRAFSDNTNMEIVDYYALLFGTFYPAIRFHSDWESLRPNVFAFEEAGQRRVVIGGALLRLAPLYGSAMAIALASGIGMVAGGGSADENGYTPVMQALEFGVGVAMRRALQGGDTWTDTALAGLAQFNALVSLLSDERPDSDHPSLQRIVATLGAVIAGSAIPLAATDLRAQPAVAAREADTLGGERRTLQ